MMPVQHVLDESFRDTRVGRRFRCFWLVPQHNEIYHAERRHQFRTRSCGEQRPRRVYNLHHQLLAGRGVSTQQLYVFGEQWIEVSGQPSRGFAGQAAAGLGL